MKILILLLVCVMLSACSVNPAKISGDYAKEFVSKLTYVMDERTGLCFAIVGSRKTGDVNSTGLGNTQVPCEKVREYLVR